MGRRSVDPREARDLARMIHERARRLSSEADTLRRLAARLLDGLAEPEDTQRDTPDEEDTRNGDTSPRARDRARRAA